jgi:hypothetical protein
VNIHSLDRIPRLPSIVEHSLDEGLQGKILVAIWGHIGSVFASEVKLYINEVIVCHLLVHIVSTLEGAHEDHVTDLVGLIYLLDF